MRLEAVATRAASKRPRGLKSQRTRPEKWLGRRHGWDTIPLGLNLYVKDC